MGRSFGTGEFLYLLKAVPWTLLLSAGALVGGAVVGLLIAILRVAPLRPLRWLATGYIELFQGTPVLMQLFVTYYGLAVLFNIHVDAWPAVLLAFTLYSGAFLGEIWRGSIQPTVGFAVQLIKSTSIAAIIGFVELTRAGQLMTNTTFKPMIIYPIVAALYFVICWPLSLLAQNLERRIDAALGLKKHF